MRLSASLPRFGMNLGYASPGTCVVSRYHIPAPIDRGSANAVADRARSPRAIECRESTLIAGRNGGRRFRADSAPTWVATGRTGVRVKAAIPLRRRNRCSTELKARSRRCNVAGDQSSTHIGAVSDMHRRGFRVALAGGLGPQTLDAVLEVEPEIVVVGSAITGADDPRGVATWIRNRLRNPGRGWPSDAR
jgi:hypothetical protein